MIMGAIIKTRRESLGLSQKDFAAMLGVSPGSVWNWENGESNPKIELILPVANALNVDPNFLFGVSEFDSLEADPQARLDALHEKFGEPKKSAPVKVTESAIIDKLNSLSEKELDDLQTFLGFLLYRRDNGKAAPEGG